MVCGFCGTQHFSFAGWSGQAFNGEAHRLHVPSHLAFRAVGDENASGFERVEHALENNGCPHFGLCGRTKCIEEDDVELRFAYFRLYFAQRFVQGEV